MGRTRSWIPQIIRLVMQMYDGPGVSGLLPLELSGLEVSERYLSPKFLLLV